MISLGAIPVSFDFDIFSPPTSNQPWPKTCFGTGDARGHQHGRPDDGMEARDVLAHDVRAGPASLEVRFVDAVADSGDVVEQRVEPDVEDVRRVPGNLDAPVEARARDRQVVQPLPDERDDLVAHTRGLYEVGLRLVQVEQRLLEVAHPEEVVGLLEHLDRTTVNGADKLAGVVAIRRFHEIVELLVLLAADAVVTLVLALVDEAVVVELLQEDQHGLLVPLIGGADEVVVGDR